jgi:endonuclease/exonuclease/phosphatase family metal-dependent hydrolase
MDLRVLTYNVHGLPWTRVPILPMLAWMSRRTSADVICLQEVFQRKAMTDLITYAPVYGYRALVPPDCVTPSCFANPSGLCTLVKDSLFVSGWEFTPFDDAGGLEWFVQKGVFRIECWKDDVRVDLFNTHFQSDVTEIPCLRIRHQHTRDRQESQVELVASRSECPIIAGDFNQSLFHTLERLDTTFHATFPETYEHLDHILVYGPSRRRILHHRTTYFDEMTASDHIPVLTCLRIRKELNAISEKRSEFE